MTVEKMTDKEWCAEYAPDMGYRFVVKTKANHHYWLIDRKGKATGFGTLVEVKNFLLRALHRYIGDHTTIVDARGKVIEKSPAEKRKMAHRRK